MFDQVLSVGRVADVIEVDVTEGGGTAATKSTLHLGLSAALAPHILVFGADWVLAAGLLVEVLVGGSFILSGGELFVPLLHVVVVEAGWVVKR